MTFKDIIILVILVAILLIVLKVMQQTKPVYITSQRQNEPSDNEFNEGKSKDKKLKIKQKYRRILKILADERPRTAEQLLEEYNSRHKEVTQGALNSLNRWLIKNNLISSEELEDGTFFGLSDWFEDGELAEEYFNNIKK